MNKHGLHFVLPILLLALFVVPMPDFAVAQEKKTGAEPKDAATSIDYQALLNDRLGKDITPDKNAVVLIWKAFGPTPSGGTRMPPEFFKRLGIAEPPKDGEYFVELGAIIKDRLKLNEADFNALDDQQIRAAKRPWGAKDYPNIAAWLKINEKPLALLVEATKRPDYYSPLVARDSDGKPGMLIGASLPATQKCREVAYALAARAMLRTENGKFEEAWQDLLACQRLGRLVSRGGTSIEALVGIAIDATANDANLAYLERAKLTSKQILECLKDLQSLPPMSSMADKIDLTERFTYLQTIQLIRQGGPGMFEDPMTGKSRKPTREELQALANIDWEPAVKNGNKWYDRMVAAIRLKDRSDREKEFDRIEKDLAELKKGIEGQNKLIKLLLKKGPPDKMIAQKIGDLLIGLLMSAVRNLQTAHDRSVQFERNRHIAFALAAYERDNGRYPAKLADLSPNYLATVQDDLFSGKQLIYKPSEKGYLLYSVGVNGKDDGGRWTDDEPPGDDPRVRMPLPPLKTASP